MSNILNKHRRQDPPDWLVNLKNIFTSKKGQLTGHRKTKNSTDVNLDVPEGAGYIDKDGNEYRNINEAFGTSKSYNTGSGVNKVDVSKPKKKTKKKKG
jgi:hypothetical protein